MSIQTNHRTAESVSPKHPDKLCDQISDAILDAHLAVDPNARVAVDVAGGHGTVFVTGLSAVTSFQNAPHDELRNVVEVWLDEQDIAQVSSGVELFINPAGDWQVGGFEADAGLTGRKLAVDNYGPRIPLGGGAFSGKDPSKVDRSAAYIARKIAIDYLHKRDASEVFVRLAYAIGHDQALEATVIVDGAQELIEGYDLTPNGIIETLELKRPIYEQTARYGHFGHNYAWESID
ncbi:methionine adenosyltransferase domain-containing protein [Candidatus Saccharibacteria bacterium]|nr:methionine adenosyltransferase domain-containing protein [Candidatus Saccharibacteria bacterium]